MFVCVVEYHSAINKKEILPFVTTWINLEGITLSDISQSQKGKHCVISHVESKTVEQRGEQIHDYQGKWGGGGRNWGERAKGHKLSAGR